jgi:hypothetical protein
MPTPSRVELPLMNDTKKPRLDETDGVDEAG